VVSETSRRRTLQGLRNYGSSDPQPSHGGRPESHSPAVPATWNARKYTAAVTSVVIQRGRIDVDEPATPPGGEALEPIAKTLAEMRQAIHELNRALVDIQSKLGD